MSNGTSGNTGSIRLTRGSREPFEWMQVAARALAADTLKSLKSIEHRSDIRLACIESELTLAVRKPDQSRLKWADETLTKNDAQLPHRWSKIYAQEAQHLSKYPEEVTVKLQAFRLGPIAIAAMPCEVFAETGLAIKKESPHRHTFSIELANGYGGYLPPREQHALGGYETWPARSSFLEVDAEEKIRTEVARLLGQVKTADSEKQSNGPHPANNPTSPVMLTGPLAEVSAGKIDFGKLPRLKVEHAVVSDVRDRGGKWVHQHGYLVHHGGRFWAMWSDGPGLPQTTPEKHRNRVPGHDQPDTRVSYATSDDGLRWSKPQPLSGPPRREGFGWIARGFWVRDGELLALASHFHAPGYTGKGLSLEAFRWDDDADKWIPHGAVFNDTLNNFPPKQLPTGDWMMTRRDHQGHISVIVGGRKAFDDWQVRPVAK